MTGVRIALGLVAATSCTALDADGDGTIGIADLVRAVRAALAGCPITPTPTATVPGCSDPGADPATGCTSCLPRHHVENAFGLAAPEGLSDGEGAAAPPDAAEERRHCMPDSFCGGNGLNCGAGSCVELPGGSAGCRCPDGQIGSTCQQCMPPLTPVAGGCTGGDCNQTMCSGHGVCVTLGAIVTCVCDPGFGGPNCKTMFKMVPVVHSVYVGASITLSTVFEAPGGCGPGVDWQIVSGGGSVSGEETKATFTAPDTVDGLVDIVTVRAAPENCPQLADETSIHVLPLGVGPIIGHATEEFEGVDQAMLQFMSDHALPGGTLALSFQTIHYYDKAFGYAEYVVPDAVEMTPGHMMRLASVSKPITRAAIRELQAAGLLNGGPNGLNDSVYSILQSEGDNILGLDDSNVPVAPLVDADYQGGTPTLCDNASPANCPVVGAPLMCPVGSVSGGAPLCPLNSPGGTGSFTLSANTWNVDGGNPRVGGSPQYDCPTDDGGGLDVPMWQRMTVSDLFWHRGGFYRGAGLNDVANGNNAKSGDPQYEPIFVSQRLPLNHPPPPTAIDMIRFNAGLCLYYPPLGCDDACCNAGSKPGPVDPWGYCTQLDSDTYSNLGYNMLGRVIEVRSGLPYEQYVTQTLLEPLGIDRVKLGKTRFSDRDPREASYYANGNATGGNLFAAVCDGSDDANCVGGTWTFPEIIAKPDGGDFALEFRDPSGGWTATSCALNELFHTYRVSDGFRRMAGVYPSGGEGTMMGFYPGTRAYVAQWGDPITVVDTVNIPAGCTSWGCLNSASVNFPLGPGWHVAAIFNKDLCTTDVCDAPGGYVFNKHDKQALLNGIAAALVKVSVLPDEVTCGCGNGIRDVGEECDGYEVGTATCTSLGFVGGDLGCTADCTYDTAKCSMCGNGVKEEGEVCDTPDFGTDSCGAHGFEMGDLICNDCMMIDTSNCSGGMSTEPPQSYKACGFDFEDPDHPADCSGGTCFGAEGDCAGGPCKPTDPSDYTGAIDDPLNDTGGEFHPDGNFRSANGTLFYCQSLGNVPMVCSDVNGWGVCKRCSAQEPQPDEHHTLVGCPCTSDDACDSPLEPGLGCFGEDYGGGIGFCWDAQDGPPSWQCPEGSCGQAPYYGNDTMYCEHYAANGGSAHCEPWVTCNSILARVCAGEGLLCECIDEEPGPPLTCVSGVNGCTTDDCCAPNCEIDSQCGTDFGWPPGYTCEGPNQGALVCEYTGGP